MKYCDNCGAQLQEDAKFCEECGNLIQQEAKEVELGQNNEVKTAKGNEEPPAKGGNSKKGILIFVTILVLFIAAVVINNYLSHNNKDDRNSNNAGANQVSGEPEDTQSSPVPTKATAPTLTSIPTTIPTPTPIITPIPTPEPTLIMEPTPTPEVTIVPQETINFETNGYVDYDENWVQYAYLQIIEVGDGYATFEFERDSEIHIYSTGEITGEISGNTLTANFEDNFGGTGHIQITLINDGWDVEINVEGDTALEGTYELNINAS